MEYSLYFVVLVLLLLGGWCVPPKWTEKVLNEIKTKYSVERIIKNEKVLLKNI